MTTRKSRTVEWQTDNIHKHPATKYSLDALKKAAKEKEIVLSKVVEVEGAKKRRALTKVELIQALIQAGETFPEPKEKVERGPSSYNLFMKQQIKKIKETGEQKDHKAAFKKAAANWTLANPKEAKEAKAPKEPKEPKGPKKPPSEYNLWVAEQIKRIKESGEQKDNKAAFAKAISNYKATHPKAPKAPKEGFYPKQRALLGM